MSDYKLPELPSDDDLGITDEDREFAKELGDNRPEMSEAELAALLGEAPKAPPAAGDAGSAKAPAGDNKQAKKAARQAAKEEKRRQKEAKKAQRAAAAAAKKAAKAGAETTERPAAEPQPDAEPQSAGVGADGGESAGGPGPDGPRSKWRGPVTLAALIVVAFVASSRTGIPGPVAANAPDTAFSSSRAMSMLTEIARDAHPPGSPEHTRVREYIVERLVDMGLEPEVQTTTSIVQSPTRARAATIRNVVARLPGTDPTGAVLMTAHYDGREISFAAGDDGSGVVSILEAVRALQATGPLRNDLIVLITDAEELGLLGARAFVDEHPLLDGVSIVLSFEMRGSGGPSIMFETNDRNGWVVKALQEFDPDPYANSMAFEVYRRMPNDTDFTPFKEAGKQGLNFAAIDNAHVYHQRWDTPENLSESTLQHHGIHALASARFFGDADLSSVDDPNVVYFSLPFAGLIVYGEGLVLPISGSLLLLLALAFFAARRTGARPTAMGFGLVISLLGIAAAFGAAWALTGWLTRFHPEAGSLHGSAYHSEGWYMLALVGVALAVFSGLYGVARRWFSATELGIGAVLLPLVAAVAVSAVAPLAAMNLQWPVAAALASLLVAGLLGPRSDSIVGWGTSLILMVPVVLFIVPVVELLWLALTFELGAALIVLPIVGLYLCTPALEALRHPNSWWAPAAGLGIGAVALGLGVLASRPSAERPSPSTLVYAYEHGTGAAVWATDPNADSLDSEAIEWAVTRAGGTYDGTRDLSGFAYRGGQTPTATAPVVTALPPQVLIASDSIDGSTRRVTLNVASAIGAEYMAFMYDARGETRLLSINGKELEDPAQLERAEHWGEPEGAVVLQLEMPADEAIGLHVIEHLLRPEELWGPTLFERPEHLGPDITRMSDRAMFRYSIGAFVDPRHAIRLPGTVPQPGLTPTPVQPADTVPLEPDTTSAGAAQPDTGGAQPDTVVAQPDTVAAQPDTGAAPPDTGAAQPDTGRAQPDSAPIARPDTGLVVPDTLVAPVDTTSARPDRRPPV